MSRSRYPVSESSGKTTRSAPRPRASAIEASAIARFASTSPSRGAIWAAATVSFRSGITERRLFRMGAEKTTPSVAEHRLVVNAEEAGKRLDVLLAERVPELSRRRARVLIAAGAVAIDDRRVLVQSRAVAAGQEVVCHMQSFEFPRSAAL